MLGDVMVKAEVSSIKLEPEEFLTFTTTSILLPFSISRNALDRITVESAFTDLIAACPSTYDVS